MNFFFFFSRCLCPIFKISSTVLCFGAKQYIYLFIFYLNDFELIIITFPFFSIWNFHLKISILSFFFLFCPCYLRIYEYFLPVHLCHYLQCGLENTFQFIKAKQSTHYFKERGAEWHAELVINGTARPRGSWNLMIPYMKIWGCHFLKSHAKCQRFKVPPLILWPCTVMSASAFWKHVPVAVLIIPFTFLPLPNGFVQQTI